MKKTLILLAITALCALSCAEKPMENPYAVNPTIKIVSADVLFSIKPSTGSIVVDAQSNYTATCQASWVSLSTSGNTVSVTVDGNPDIYGRSAIVLLTCEDYSTEVCIQQNGITYNNEFVSYEGGSFVIDASSLGQAFTVSCDDSWITYIVEGEKINVTVDKNSKPADRTAKIKVESPTADLIYVISQNWQFDLTGKYTLEYYANSTTTTVTTAEVTFTRSDTNKTQYFITGLKDYTIVANANEEDATLSLTNGQYLGQYSDVYHYLCCYYSNKAAAPSYYFSYSTDSKYDVYFNIEYDETIDGFVISLKDSAKAFNSDRLSQGFAVRSFSTDPSVALATGNAKSTILTVKQPKFTLKK